MTYYQCPDCTPTNFCTRCTRRNQNTPVLPLYRCIKCNKPLNHQLRCLHCETNA